MQTKNHIIFELIKELYLNLHKYSDLIIEQSMKFLYFW